ncbi:hypothetical protein ACIBO2_42610 [Nonomuraea sp. NPDC050022]|uniref:hypothetical protein n=1 Tax=unclassified Nonomuraea TaxID=2593643 RepID=UPI00340BC071
MSNRFEMKIGRANVRVKHAYPVSESRTTFPLPLGQGLTAFIGNLQVQAVPPMPRCPTDTQLGKGRSLNKYETFKAGCRRFAK